MLQVTPQWGQLQVSSAGNPQTLQVASPSAVILEVGMASSANVAVAMPVAINLDIGVQGPPGAGSGGGGFSYFPSGW